MYIHISIHITYTYEIQISLHDHQWANVEKKIGSIIYLYVAITTAETQYSPSIHPYTHTCIQKTSYENHTRSIPVVSLSVISTSPFYHKRIVSYRTDQTSQNQIQNQTILERTSIIHIVRTIPYSETITLDLETPPNPSTHSDNYSNQTTLTILT